MGRRYANILETVGNTPVVRINKLAPADVNLFVKIEAFNPLGSVKDRLALGVIEDAERRGLLKPGQTVIEATSGNTGIGLAMVCAQKGYPLVVTMAESFSVERRKLMRFLGAKVVLTPGRRARHGHGQQGQGARRDARLVPDPPVRERGQRRHALTHHGARDHRGFQGHAARLLGHRLRHGGTLKGVARVLAKEMPNTKIVVCEPADASMLTSGTGQAAQAGRLAGSSPSGVEAASDAGLGAGLHSQADGRCRGHAA